jgi:hypothetical protein
MEKDLTFGKAARGMKENSEMENLMAKEFTLGLMELDLK